MNPPTPPPQEEQARAEAEEEAAAAAPEREPIYNHEALAEALEDIVWPATISWVEAQAVYSTEATAIADVEDDLSRELAFYNQVHARYDAALQRLRCTMCS